MPERVRRFLAWLLMAAIPLQGSATAFMTGCAAADLDEKLCAPAASAVPRTEFADPLVVLDSLDLPGPFKPPRA